MNIVLALGALTVASAPEQVLGPSGLFESRVNTSWPNGQGLENIMQDRLQTKLAECPQNTELLDIKETLTASAGVDIETGLAASGKDLDASTLQDLKKRLDSITCGSVKPPTTAGSMDLQQIRDQVSKMLEECPNTDALIDIEKDVSAAKDFDANTLQDLKKRLDSITCGTNKPPTTGESKDLQQIRDQVSTMLKECPNNTALIDIEKMVSDGTYLVFMTLPQLKKRLDSITCGTSKPPTTGESKDLQQIREKVSQMRKECPNNDALIDIERMVSDGTYLVFMTLPQLKKRLDSITCGTNKPPTTGESKELQQIREKVSQMRKECPNNDALIDIEKMVSDGTYLVFMTLPQLKKRLDSITCGTHVPSTSGAQKELQELREKVSMLLKECPENADLLDIEKEVLSSEKALGARSLQALVTRLDTIPCDSGRRPAGPSNPPSDRGSSDSESLLWAILGGVGALCLSASVVAVALCRRRHRTRDEDQYVPVMPEPMHDTYDEMPDSSPKDALDAV